MNKEFVSYDQALKLKELGFDEPCFGYYNNLGNYVEDYGKTNSNCNKLGMYGKYCTAPLYSQIFRWFREKHNLISNIDCLHYGCTLEMNTFIYKIVEKTGSGTYDIYDTYEEAELACLEKLIEIVK